MSALAARAAVVAHGFTPRDLTNLLYGLAAMGMRETEAGSVGVKDPPTSLKLWDVAGGVEPGPILVEGAAESISVLTEGVLGPISGGRAEAVGGGGTVSVDAKGGAIPGAGKEGGVGSVLSDGPIAVLAARAQVLLPHTNSRISRISVLEALYAPFVGMYPLSAETWHPLACFPRKFHQGSNFADEGFPGSIRINYSFVQFSGPDNLVFVSAFFFQRRPSPSMSETTFLNLTTQDGRCI